jgi:hypothetical protein
MAFAKCERCFKPLTDPNPCVHRQRYVDLEAHVCSKGITVRLCDDEHFAWKPSGLMWDNHNCRPPKNIILISSVGHAIYGWDVITSCLIHEWGHHDQLTQDAKTEPTDWDEKIKYEIDANGRGRNLAPSHLVPEDYAEHRDFFLRSYVEHGWNKERLLSEWKKYQEA